MASLVNSAWAMTLSNITGEEDVVYGQWVAGRNADLPGIMDIIGPCLNVVPIRVTMSSTQTSEELLQSVQNQFALLEQSDSMGWDEIVADCTDWPAQVVMDSVVEHLNIDAEFKSHFPGTSTKIQWFENPYQRVQIPYLFVLSQPWGNELKISISGNTSFVTVDMANALLSALVDLVTLLSSDLHILLASCKSSSPVYSRDLRR